VRAVDMDFSGVNRLRSTAGEACPRRADAAATPR